MGWWMDRRNLPQAQQKYKSCLPVSRKKTCKFKVFLGITHPHYFQSKAEPLLWKRTEMFEAYFAKQIL